MKKNLASCLLLLKRTELIQSVTEMQEKNPEAYKTIVEGIFNIDNKQIENFFDDNPMFKQYSIPPEEIEDYLSEYLSKHDLNELAETMLAAGNQTAAPTNTESGRRSVERWHDFYNARNGEEEEEEQEEERWDL